MVMSRLYRWLAMGVMAAGAAGTAAGQSKDRGNGFLEHGVGAPVSRARGITAAQGKDGRPKVLVWLSDHRACKSMLVIDAITGETEQIDTPATKHNDSPFAVLLSAAGRYYSLWGFRFMEFDPVAMKFTFVGETPDRVAMSMTEDANGVIWASTYPGSHIAAFDPKTGKLTNYGPVNKETWPQYPRVMCVDRAGWVYLGIGNTRSHIVAFDPKTKKIVPIAKDEERAHGGGHVYLATDGKVYGRPNVKGTWYVLSAGESTPIEAPPGKLPKPPAAIKTGSQESVFRDFPDGRRIEEIDVPEKWMSIRDPKSKQVRRVTFDYASEGSHILSLVLGPDARIYGSTGHPLRILRYDPAKDAFTNNGLLTFNGHWNALAVQKGRVYGGQYGGGILWEYDVTRPWADKAKKDPNPRRILQSAPTINRPHELLAHPDGRHLVLAGTPGYGLTGGGLHVYDIETDKRELIEHTELVPDQATKCLEALSDGNLVGGTTVAPGTGGQTVAKEAELYLMDFATRKITWHQAIVPGASEIVDIKVGPDGLVYGVATGPVFFVFDPKTRKVVHTETLKDYGNPSGGQASRILLVGPDKKIYAYFQKAIVRIEPGSFKHTKLATPPVDIQTGIVLHEGRLYFTHDSRLWSWGIPGLASGG